jgi:hypothetical protein
MVDALSVRAVRISTGVQQNQIVDAIPRQVAAHFAVFGQVHGESGAFAQRCGDVLSQPLFVFHNQDTHELRL